MSTENENRDLRLQVEELEKAIRDANEWAEAEGCGLLALCPDDDDVSYLTVLRVLMASE